eukprot:13868722-Ditylum_brightwellii.AAC.1
MREILTINRRWLQCQCCLPCHIIKGGGSYTNLPVEEVITNANPLYDGQLPCDLWDHGLCLALAILQTGPLVGERPDHSLVNSV